MSNEVRTRKIILDLAVSLDGFIEGKNGEVDWCIMDPEMEFTNFLNQIDTILYGRKSYDLWGQYTPTTGAPDDEKKCGSWFTVRKNMCFLERKKGLTVK